MDANKIEVKETVSAGKKLGKKEAIALAKGSSKVIVSKGKKVQEFKPGPRPSTELVAAMLGATGNLRAPTLCVGKTLLIGFNQEVYEEVCL